MPEPTLDADVLADLLNDLRAVGPLAKNEKSFAAAFEAYRAADAKTYQAVLRRLKLFPRCRYVCIFNWESIRGSDSILKAITELVEASGRDKNGSANRNETSIDWK